MGIEQAWNGLRILPRPWITGVVREGGPLGKSPGKFSHPLLDCKTAYLQALRYAGGGTRIPDTRIMIRVEGCCGVSLDRLGWLYC